MASRGAKSNASLRSPPPEGFTLFSLPDPIRHPGVRGCSLMLNECTHMVFNPHKVFWQPCIGSQRYCLTFNRLDCR